MQKQQNSIESNLIELFKVQVVSLGNKLAMPNLDNMKHGFVTDFVPSAEQLEALKAAFQPIPVTTLFTVQERKNSEPWELIHKQLLHYVEIYGLNQPGLFNLEVRDGTTVVFGYVKGVTDNELGSIVRNAIYANKPLKQVEELKEIIGHYSVVYDLAKVANNEMRIALYREGDTFPNGDDAVRYIVYTATDNTLLIKSPEVIKKVAEMRHMIGAKFLERHKNVLAQVFNRHKRLIMALKDGKTRQVINAISRLSKKAHVPLRPHVSKFFVAGALRGEIENIPLALSKVSVRDKLKYLNLLEFKMLGSDVDIFPIRNGKAHVEKNRQKFTSRKLRAVQKQVIDSLRVDLAYLAGKSILLDANVDYGLPISQKQTFGNLPFGTMIDVGKKAISSGVYWENAWGARDLDLSAIDETGQRTGWGSRLAYARENEVLFSGDVTDAPNGAMEFLTSPHDFKSVYGLFVNIFAGELGCKAELVIGTQTKNRWIEEPLIREKTNLLSRGNIIGFVREGKFIVYYLRMSDSRASFRVEKPKLLIQKALAPAYTVLRLLDELGIDYELDRDHKKAYDFDMSYSGFSLNKLEELLLPKAA